MTTPSHPSVPGRMIACSGCGQPNAADRKFCGGCGGKLWEPCMSCGATNASDEQFCGNCGVRIADSIRAHEDQLKVKLELAIKQEREGRYYDAASTLRAISAQGDPRLESYQENAQKLLSQLDQRRKTRQQQTQQLAAQARTYANEQQIVKAHQSLQQIPPGLRSTEIVQQMMEIEGDYKQIVSLKDEIKQSLQAKTYDGLRPKVERLCELEPANTEAQTLARRLANQEDVRLARAAGQYVAQAQKMLASGKYAAAAERVNKIDPKYVRGKVQQVYRHVAESAWYWQQLERSTTITPTLLEIAQRAVKRNPADSRLAQVAQELAARAQQQQTDPRHAVTSWRKAPSSTPLGCPIKPWPGFARVSIEDTQVRDTLLQHANRLVCAYGLALQGVGLGPLQHDLRPNRSKWTLGFSKKAPERIWGVDLSNSGAKAIELVYDAAEEQLQMTGCIVREHKRPLAQLQDPLARQKVVTETMTDLVQLMDQKRPRVALGFSSRMGLARFFDLPPIKNKKTKLADAVRYEMRSKIPMPLEEAVIGHHAWDPQGDGFVQLRSVAAIAAAREELEQWIQPVLDSGCELHLLQCDGFAIYNALYYEFLATGANTLAVLDIGSDITNLVVGSGDYAWMRSVVGGAERWTAKLVEAQSLTREQAQQVRHTPERVRWMHQVDQLLQPLYADLVGDVSRSLDAYPRRTDSPPQMLLITGGGSGQFGLLNHLQYGESII